MGQSGQGVRLSTHIIMPTLKISGAIPPLPHMPNYFSTSLSRNRDLKSLGTTTFMAGFN